jgi:hypothetical protein
MGISRQPGKDRSQPIRQNVLFGQAISAAEDASAGWLEILALRSVSQLFDEASQAGGTIDLNEIATPEILDPRQVKGLHSGLCTRNVLRALAGVVNGDHLPALTT